MLSSVNSPEEPDMTLIPDLLAMTERFNRQIIGLPIPANPTRLDPDRKRWSMGAMSEELTEFEDAETLEDEVDALIDLAYFALGRLVEMGVAPRPVFEVVHNANMAKERGELSKRPHAKGFDAIKPTGWKAPDLKPLLSVTLDDYETLSFLADLTADNPVERRRAAQAMAQSDQGAFTPKAMLPEWPEPELTVPKVLILGFARHGKDTVSEMLRDHYGLSFQSSSMFCADKVLWRIIHDADARVEFLSTVQVSRRHLFEAELAMMADEYVTVEDCFEGRGNHRELWYLAIRAFNTPDATSLGRALFDQHDVYCGLRHAAEFHALVNAGIPDLVVWIGRSDHLDPEDHASCSVEPWMADYVIDNNGSLEDLERNVRSLFDRILSEE